jgi:hypothetical protein
MADTPVQIVNAERNADAVQRTQQDAELRNAEIGNDAAEDTALQQTDLRRQDERREVDRDELERARRIAEDTEREVSERLALQASTPQPEDIAAFQTELNRNS